MITGEYRIVDVRQVDLDLTWRVLRDDGIGGTILRITIILNIIEKRLYFVEVVRMVDLYAGLRAAEPWYAGRSRCWLVCFGVEQIEFELCCHDDLDAHFFERRRGTFNNPSLVEEIRAAVILEHAKQGLRHRSA